MKKIWTPTILLPALLRSSKELVAAQNALEPQLELVSKAALETLHLPRLDMLPTAVLDVLANQYHADFFELGMTDEDKRAIIRDVIRWHRIKGTPAAVEEIARKFFRSTRVEEWFEYGGEPFWFRVVADLSADTEDVTRDIMARLRATVKESKNTRSWVDFYGFEIFAHETIETSEAHSLFVERFYHDEYDYRRRTRRRAGASDYGTSVSYLRNGTIARDGTGGRRGWEAHGDHGRLQATDFEVLRLTTEYDWKERLEPGDEMSALNVSLSPHHDAAAPAESLSAIDVTFVWEDRKDWIGDQNPFEVTLSGLAATLEPLDGMSAFDISLTAFNDSVTIGETTSLFDVTLTGLGETIDVPQTHALDISLSAEDQETVGGHLFLSPYFFHHEPAPTITRTHDLDVGLSTNDQAPTITEARSLDISLATNEQAPTIEGSLAFAVTLSTEDSVDTAEDGIIELTLTGTEDSVTPFDPELNFEVEHAYHETVEPPTMNGSFFVTQNVSRNGKITRNGSVRRMSGQEAAMILIDAAEMAMWYQMYDEYKDSFKEECGVCGAATYSFEKGSIRIGTEHFLITDPQYLTLRIRCAQCSNVIAEIIVPNNELEVLT